MKFKKSLSMLLAVLIMAAVIPFGALTVYAAETAEPQPEKEYRGFVPYSEFKTPMSETAIAAIYKAGELVYEEFASADAENSQINVFKKAITEFAPSIRDKGKVLSDAEIEALPEVRVVLNTDLVGNLLYLDEIKGVKLMIDLNGHYMFQTTANANNEAIHVYDKAQLTIVDSNTDAKWDMKSDSIRFKPYNHSVETLWGGLILGNLKGHEHKEYKIHIDNAKVTMLGGSIAGFKRETEAVLLSHGATLGLYHSAHVYFNKCTESVIKLTGKSTLTGDVSSTVDTNTTTTYGTVYSNGEGNTVSGITIAYNASSGAGGVYADSACTLKDLNITTNSGYRYAGGIYLKKGGTVENCTVTKNGCSNRGGGIHVVSETLTLKGGTITGNNSQEHGAGVLVTANANVSISGCLVIKDNKRNLDLNYEYLNSNLYIEGNNDLAPGTLTLGSEIWIRTGKSAAEYNGKDKTITAGGHANRTGASPAFFWADESGYYVDLISEVSHKNYRSLCLMKGERPTYNDVQILESFDTVEIPGGYRTPDGAVHPLIKGYFEYNLMSDDTFYSASPFYYSDGYFIGDPTVYNEHLATMSINMAVAAFGRHTDDVGTNKYANHFANVKQLMSDIGCADEDFYVNSGYQNRPEFFGKSDQLSTIGVAISKKVIQHEQSTAYLLIPVVIRGGSYEVEWASNVTIGKTGEATGFADAANQVYTEVQNYIKAHNLENWAELGRIRFWVTGYSRAGATANLTSKRLVDTYAEKGNQVFGYTFEAPMGGVQSAIVKADYTGDGKYPTIHNTVNENDFVTLVAPQEMGFIRYGVDHLVGSEHDNNIPVSYDTSSAYWERRQAMVAQLAAINPYYVFDDYWTAADINVYMGLGGSWDLTEPENTKNKDYTTMYKGIRSFFLRVQKYGLETSDKKNFREKYSTATPLKGKKIPWYLIGNHYTSDDITSKNYFLGKSDYSVQKGVQVLMKMMYTHPHIDEILETAMNNFNTRLEKMHTLSKAGWLSTYLEQFHDGLTDRRPETLNNLCHMLLDPLNDGDKKIWDYMLPSEQKEFANALPIVLYFLLEYIQEDYQGRTGTTLCTGSFVHNIDAIISNHYQEISVAWVRSNDSYYANDLQAYRVDKNNVKMTEMKKSYAVDTNTMTLKAQPGSSVFYSTDGGVNWTLYTTPVTFASKPASLDAFYIYRGVKSGEVTVDSTLWAGTILGDGNVWFVLAGAAVIVVASVVTAECVRKKKKEDKSV